MTGCDTTSAMFRRGKTTIFKLFEKENFITCAQAFEDINSSPETLITNGIRFLLSVYGAPNKITSIDKLRYLSFAKQTRNKKRVQLACLPPTAASAHQHFYRVYYQVQVWLGNQLDPEQWGWKHVNNVLEPIHTLLPPAPENLLNSIFCNCKKGCNSRCGCKKVGLFCSLACTTCQGQSCSNVESPTEEDFHINDETTDVSLLVQFTSTQEDEEEEENGEREEDGGEEEEISNDDYDE
jgi:hypothetical protein